MRATMWCFFFTLLILLHYSAAQSITLTYSLGTTVGGLAKLTLSSSTALVTGDSFQIGFNTQYQLFFPISDDMLNNPSNNGALCVGTTNDLTTSYALLSPVSVGNLQAGVQINVNQAIAANTQFQCTLRLYTNPITLTAAGLTFNNIQQTPNTAPKPQKTYTLASPISVPTPSQPTFSPKSVIYSNKQDSTLAMNFLDLSTIDFTVENLQTDVAIAINVYPFDTTEDLSKIVDFDNMIAVFNEITPFCTPSTGELSKSGVQMYIYPANNAIYILTSSNPSSTVTCHLPFSFNQFNLAQKTSPNPQEWVTKTFKFLIYNSLVQTNPTPANSFEIVNPKWKIPYLDRSITSYSKSGTDFVLSKLTTTAKGSSFQIIASSKTFTTAATGYDLATFLSKSTTRVQLTAQIDNIDNTTDANNFSWSEDKNANTFTITIPTAVPGQLFTLFILFPLNELITPLKHDFSIQIKLISGDSVPLEDDAVTFFHYSPAIIIDPESKILQSTFTTTEYTFQYLLFPEWPTTPSFLRRFFDNETLFDYALNFWVEPNLETRETTLKNLNPICTMTSNRAVADMGDETAATLFEFSSITQLTRTGVTNFDEPSRVYYRLTGRNMKLSDILTMSCTYEIISTNKQFFPASVDLINQIVIRNTKSTFAVAQAYPVALKWWLWWFVLETGPRVLMANEYDPEFCIKIVGPNTITDQSTLDLWLTDVLSIFHSAESTSGSQNWFKTKIPNISVFHWTWALSQYYGGYYPALSPYSTNYSSQNTMLHFCIDPHIASLDASIKNTLFEEAFAKNKDFSLLTVTYAPTANELGYYADQSMVYFAPDKSQVPVLNFAMGTNCITTPQCQAQGIDFCYNGVCTAWVDLPFSYFVYARQWKSLTFTETGLVGKLLGEYFNFDIHGWTSMGAESESGAEPGDNDDPNASSHYYTFGVLCGFIILLSLFF